MEETGRCPKCHCFLHKIIKPDGIEYFCPCCDQTVHVTPNHPKKHLRSWLHKQPKRM